MIVIIVIIVILVIIKLIIVLIVMKWDRGNMASSRFLRLDTTSINVDRPLFYPPNTYIYIYIYVYVYICVYIYIEIYRYHNYYYIIIVIYIYTYMYILPTCHSPNHSRQCFPVLRLRHGNWTCSDQRLANGVG